MTLPEAEHIHRVSFTDDNGEELTPAEQDARITAALLDRFPTTIFGVSPMPSRMELPPADVDAAEIADELRDPDQEAN